MIDFNNATFVKLHPVKSSEFYSIINPILVKGERILSSYKAIRDGVIFTNYRIISMNAQGLTGTKKDFTSLPYSKIQVYSIETSGVLDYDCELDLWFSGLGKIRFEFTRSQNMAEICKIISERVLDIPFDAKPAEKEESKTPEPHVCQQNLKTENSQYCPYCYRMLEGDPDFCPKCGKRLK